MTADFNRNKDPLGMCEMADGPDASVYLAEARSLISIGMTLDNENCGFDNFTTVFFAIQTTLGRLEACLNAGPEKSETSHDDNKSSYDINELNYIEKMGALDVKPVSSPVSHQNAQQAFDLLMGIRAIGLLMANQSENSEGLSVDRQQDLGALIYFLSDQPSSFVGEVESEVGHS